MMYFGNRRPRGFHFTYRFSDERRDILDSLRRGESPESLARRSPDESRPGSGTPPLSRLRQHFHYVGLLAFVALVLLLTFFALVLYAL